MKKSFNNNLSKNKIVVLFLVLVLISFFIIRPLFIISSGYLKQKYIVNKAFSYLEEGNVEMLKNLFSNYTSSNENFENELKELFEFFDGQLTDDAWSVIKKDGVDVEETYYDFGKIEKWNIATFFKQVETTTGRIYDFSINIRLNDTNSSDKIGINAFEIRASGDYSSANEGWYGVSVY